MAWHTPVTWEIAQLVGATDLNEQLRDNLLVLISVLNTTTGKITGLNSNTLEDLSGAGLTGIAKLASANTFTAGVQDFSGARLVLPVGADRWAT